MSRQHSVGPAGCFGTLERVWLGAAQFGRGHCRRISNCFSTLERVWLGDGDHNHERPVLRQLFQ